MDRKIIFFSVIILFTFSSCSSAPRYPTDKQWNRTPIFRTDSKTLEVQGDFNNETEKFLIAAARLEDGFTPEQVAKIGFNPELKDHPCDAIGWLETSQIILGNSMVTNKNIDEVVKNKKNYSAIRCRARDIRIRSDRAFTFIHHKDTYQRGTDLTLTIIFKKNKVIGIDLNKKPLKPHERQSAFFQILGEVISTPKIGLDPNKFLP